MKHESTKPGAHAPPDDDASAPSSLITETATTNLIETINPEGTQTMNNSTSNLVAGTNVSGIVESKNQHGVSLTIDGNPAFLPVAALNGTELSEIAKGTELAVTVVSTDGAKPRVAIASDLTTESNATTDGDVAETTAAGTAEVVESTEDETVADEPSDDLSASIAALAKSWGASVKVDSGKRPASSKSKPSRKVVVAPAVAAPVAVKAVEPEKVVAPAVVEAKVEPVAVVESKSPKAAFLETIKVGDTVTASVKFKKDFGVHLTVGKLGFGLLHVTEMPGATPAERADFLGKLRYKQELQVRVIKVDHEAGRLGFSLIADEKAEFFASLKVGVVVEGTVNGTKPGTGAFINLGNTTVGLLHVSEVDGSRDERDGKLAGFKRGDKLELVVIDVNREKQEVRLSQRRLQLAGVVAGAEVTGTFVHVRNNTVVVDLDCGARGFLTKKQGGKRYENGETITAKVKSVNIGQGTVELV